MKWVTGNNLPGYLPDTEPVAHDNWTDAWVHGSHELEQVYLEDLTNSEEFTAAHEVEQAYQLARAAWVLASPEHPVLVTYGDRVWWLADLPVTDNEERNT